MSPASMNAAAAPGFFGKLPARGDFVSRRLRRDFLDPWDRWLQTAMATSREQLRENWLSRYLTSPLWRFALSPGVCGEQAYTGVLMPSVDRVGRYYPMAIALALETAPDPLGLIQTNWFEETERVALLVKHVIGRTLRAAHQVVIGVAAILRFLLWIIAVVAGRIARVERFSAVLKIDLQVHGVASLDVRLAKQVVHRVHGKIPVGH